MPEYCWDRKIKNLLEKLLHLLTFDSKLDDY